MRASADVDPALLAWPEPFTRAVQPVPPCAATYGLCTSKPFPLRGAGEYTRYGVSRRHLLVAFAVGATAHGIHALLAPLGARVTGAMPERGFAVVDFDRAFDFERWAVRTTEQGNQVQPERGPIEQLAAHPLVGAVAYDRPGLVWDGPYGAVMSERETPGWPPDAEPWHEPPLPVAGRSVSLFLPPSDDPECQLAAHIMPKRSHERHFAVVVTEHPRFIALAPPCCGPAISAAEPWRREVWLGTPGAGRYRVRARGAQLELGVLSAPLEDGDWSLDVRVKLAVARALNLRCAQPPRATGALTSFARELALRHPELTEAQHAWILAVLAGVHVRPGAKGFAYRLENSCVTYSHSYYGYPTEGTRLPRGTAHLLVDEDGRERIDVRPFVQPARPVEARDAPPAYMRSAYTPPPYTLKLTSVATVPPGHETSIRTSARRQLHTLRDAESLTRQARTLRVAASVRLEVVIDARGAVRTARLADSSLTQRAAERFVLQQVRSWTFFSLEPAQPLTAELTFELAPPRRPYGSPALARRR